MWIENSVLHLSYYVHKFSPFSHFFFAAKNSYNHSFIQCFDSFRSIRAFCDLPLYINLAFGSIALVHWMLTITSPPPLPRSECTPRIMGSSFRIHSQVLSGWIGFFPYTHICTTTLDRKLLCSPQSVDKPPTPSLPHTYSYGKTSNGITFYVSFVFCYCFCLVSIHISCPRSAHESHLPIYDKWKITLQKPVDLISMGACGFVVVVCSVYQNNRFREWLLIIIIQMPWFYWA